MTQTSREAYTPIPWRTHLQERQRGVDRWKQGQHVLIVASTQTGKTTLAQDVCRLRSHVVVFVSKVRDPSFRKHYPADTWTILEEWPKDGPKPWQNKILLWPRPVKGDMDGTVAHMRHIFYRAMNAIYDSGDWCVVVDEGLMFSEPAQLNLGKSLSHLHYWGASSGISMVTLTQRPRWIPRVVMSSIDHAYVSSLNDTEDMKKLSEMDRVNRREMEDALSRLGRHDFLYLNPRGTAVPVIVNTRK